jgi:hypothetical protein
VVNNQEPYGREHPTRTLVAAPLVDSELRDRIREYVTMDSEPNKRVKSSEVV